MLQKHETVFKTYSLLLEMHTAYFHSEYQLTFHQIETFLEFNQYLKKKDAEMEEYSELLDSQWTTSGGMSVMQQIVIPSFMQSMSLVSRMSFTLAAIPALSLCT